MQTNRDEMTDEELARQARAGSSSCFEELVRRFQVSLLRFLLRRVGLRNEAEDLLQETFVRAYERLDQYRDAWPFRTWLFTIAHRLAIDHGRRARTREAGQLPEGLSASAEHPADRMAQREERHGLWETARRVLNEEQYAAVWLHYVEEMPATDIARVMGRSWVGIKTMLHRARKRLQPHLAPLIAPQAPAVVVQDDENAALAVKAGDV